MAAAVCREQADAEAEGGQGHSDAAARPPVCAQPGEAGHRAPVDAGQRNCRREHRTPTPAALVSAAKARMTASFAVKTRPRRGMKVSQLAIERCRVLGSDEAAGDQVGSEHGQVHGDGSPRSPRPPGTVGTAEAGLSCGSGITHSSGVAVC